MDEPRDRADRSGQCAAQRERDLRPPHARPGQDRFEDRAAHDDERAEPAGDRGAVRYAPGAPVQHLSRARLRHPDPRGRRLPGALPASDGRDQAEPADHRPVPAPDAGRAYAGIEAPRGQYAVYAMSDGTDQPFRMRIHDPSFLHLQSVGLMMPGHLVADTMAIMASLDPIMGGVDK